MSGFQKWALSATVLTGFLMLSVAQPAQASDEMYQQFGGKAGITTMIDKFVGYVAADTRINGYFAHANIPHLKYELVQQVCYATGGPCTYTGKDMTAAHEGMGITDAAFNALDEDLDKAMDDQNVPIGAQNYLTAILAPMEQQVVTKH
jgi:hemoglobin